MEEETKTEEQQAEKEQQNSETPKNINLVSEERDKKVEIKTIMPTMIDDEEDNDKIEKKQDISSIVPTSVKLGEQEGVKLKSQSELLKSDGSVVLGTVSGEGIAMQENAALPQKIDIEARKKEAKELREGKKKKGKVRDVNKAKQEMKTLNKKTLIVFLMIALLLGSVYYIIKNPGIHDFQPKMLNIELGDKLPVHAVDYVIPGSGQTVDDLTYIIDTSNVDPEVVGEYQYSVRHNNVVKLGRITIEDTTPPKFEAKDLTITEGVEYDATDFVKDCFDYSGCNYSFEEEGIEKKNTAPGDYTMYVIATDIYENKTVKQVNLTIEERGKVKYFIKEDEYDPALGYSLVTKYELHFTDMLDTAVILNGTKITIKTYQDEEKYQADYKEEYATEGTTVNEEKMIITHTEVANKIGDNERFEYVIAFLTNNGYRETNSKFE